METIPCPGCRTELSIEVTTCPICLRPRNKYEIARAYTQLHAEQARLRRRPFLALAAVAAAGALAGAVYYCRAPILGAVAAVRMRFAGFVDESTDARNLVSHPNGPLPLEEAPAPLPAKPQDLPAAPRSPAASGVPQSFGVSVRLDARKRAHAPSPAPSPPPSRRASTPVRAKEAPVFDLPLPRLDPMRQWALRGRVYDLLTLRPVPRADLSFDVAGGGGGGYARTDDLGRYVVVLPRLQEGGYEIRAASDGYAPTALYESDIPYARLPVQDRRAIVHNALDGDVSAAALTDTGGEAAQRRDVFLAPLR